MEKIEIRARTAAGRTPYKHLFIVYTDGSGKEYTLRGGPGNLSIFDQIDVEYGPYDRSSSDWVAPADRKSDLSVTLVEGASLEDTYREMVFWANAIERSKPDYNTLFPWLSPLTQNSNTFVTEVLDRVGISVILPPGATNAPGVSTTQLDPELDAYFAGKSSAQIQDEIAAFKVEFPSLDQYVNRKGDYCFAKGTPIQMADGRLRPIELVAVGDQVSAFDPNAKGGRGALVSCVVTQTFVNEDRDLLNFHGTLVTPGHMFLSGDGSFRRLDDILAADDTIVSADGVVLRARTNLPVGAEDDRPIPVAYRNDKGEVCVREMRAGAPYGRRSPDGPIYTLLGKMDAHGYRLRGDGLFENDNGEVRMAAWEQGDPSDSPTTSSFLVTAQPQPLGTRKVQGSA